MKINLKNVLFYLSIATLLTPFFIDIESYFPFIIGKATVFRIIIGLMLIIWSLWMFGRYSDKKNLAIFKNSLIKVVIIFGIIIFISALFGIDFYYSFFSGNERMEGVLGIWYFIAFFLVVSTTFKYLEIEKILKIQVFISLLYSLLALLPFLRIGQVIIQITGDRLVGYTGNPSYFAVYLLFNAFLALYFYFRQYEIDKRIFNWWFIAFLAQSFLIFVTLTRGAMIGYFISVILIALAIIFLSKDKILLPFKKISIIFLISISVLSIFTFAERNTDFVKNNSILNRFASISLTDPTARSRLFSAETAWISFLQKPIFGWGQENYEAAYVQNFNPEVLKYLPGDFYFDRVHNKPMEVLATNGIFGFLSYLSIFGVAFYFLNQLRKKQEWFLPSLALGGCLAGYFIQNIFIFDFHESYLMFFLLLSFMASLCFYFQESKKCSTSVKAETKEPYINGDDDKSLNEKNKMKNGDNAKNFSFELANYFVIIVIICLVIFSTSQWVIRPYFVSKGIIKVGSFINQGKGEEAFRELRKILNNPAFLKDDIIVGVKKIYSLHGSKIEEKDRKKIVETLLFEVEAAVQEKPWRFSLMSTKAGLETIAFQWDKNWLLKAEKSTEMMISRFPYFPQTYLFASKFYLLNGAIEESIGAAEKVIELDSSIPTSYYFLSVAYNELKDMEKRNDNLIKAAELNYPFNDKDQILIIINLLVKEKDYSTIEKLYLRAIQIDPQDVSLYTSLAATYAKMQNKGKAIEYAKKAVELNPAAQEAAEEFIQLVENEQWEMVGD
jgi:O-antigen ligase